MPTTETVKTTAKLRGLLRTARRVHGFSQRQAAERTPCDLSWWKRIESGYETVVSTDKLIAMLEAVNVGPEHLDDIDAPELAELLLARQSFRDLSTSRESLEEYLMKAPASEELRHELIIWVRARNAMKVGRLEPFTDQFKTG